MNNNIGVRERSASITEGCRFATAVPEVQTIGVGTPVLFARPSAKNPADRSSKWTYVVNSGLVSMAKAKGADRPPGVMQACLIPARSNSSTIA